MKHLRVIIFCLIISLLLLTLGGCAGSRPAVEGVWQKIAPPTQHGDQPAVKVLTDGHFAFGNQVGGRRGPWSGGGLYDYKDGEYTETVVYHSLPSLVGMTINFECVIKDGKWFHEADFEAGGERFHIVEVWERVGVVEGED